MSAAGTQGLMHGPGPAEELVNNMISNYNNQVTVHDLINELERCRSDGGTKRCWMCSCIW
ncbi:MAG: hypothetical protein R2791_12405 [Saprospiraceae bacterium]